MSKTQRIDIIRNITKQPVSWISIIVISSFAVAAYLGLTFSSYGLRKAGNDLYSSTNFHDIQITSNCMLSDDDLKAVSTLPGIGDVEGLYKVSAKLSSNSLTENINITSMPQKIGLPIIKSGSAPSSSSECMVESVLAKKLGLSIGDVVTPTDSYQGELPELCEESFTITGIFEHAEHATFDLEENYCVIVPSASFDHEKLNNCYSFIEVTISESFSSGFGKDYTEYVDNLSESIENLSEGLKKDRYDNHIAFLKDEITDGQKELSDAKSDLKLAGRMISSLDGKTGPVMADLSNMMQVIISSDPSEYKTGDEQKADFFDALKKYNAATKNLEAVKKRYDKLLSEDECVWYVFTRNANLDYVYLKTNAENLRSINMSFSLLFVLIAVMVIFASLSRMVLEQRRLIGVSKALGLRNREIYSKYLTFGFSAAAIGITLGIILSVFVLEGVIALGFGDHFIFGMFPFVVEVVPTIVTILLAAIVAVFSINMSTGSLLKKTAKKLLAPFVPKDATLKLKKSAFLSKLNLYNKTIILNIRTDIVRVVVTILSISGCCALIVIGFSLRFSIAGMIDRQLHDYSKYDGIITVNSDISDTVFDETKALLDKYNATYSVIRNTHESFKIGDTMEYAEFIMADDIQTINEFHPLMDFKTKKLFTSLPDEGVLINNRIAELYDLKPGDEVSILDDMGYAHKVKIAGSIKNYIGRYLVTKKSYYESAMKDSYPDNAFFVRFDNDIDKEAVLSQLAEINGYESYSSSEESVSMFENLMIVLDLIVWLLIILAGVMALFVLLNLANMYMVSKNTELTIMRVNGFTVKETIKYAIREVYVTTSLGVILGIIIGASIVYYVLRRMEQAHLMFVREPSIPACIIGTFITILYIAGIYYLSFRKVGSLSLKNL